MNKDRSYLWFVIPLLGFIAMMLIIGASMAKGAGTGVDQVPKLISRTTPADTAYIAGDTLYINQMAVTLASLLKAVAVQVDTVRGANTILAILDDTVRIDPDSSGSLITITFGGYGGGIRWNRSSDAMEFTNDFTTWTTFGSGSGTGDIEGVTAGDGLSGGGTSGTPTLDVKPGWGLYIHDDSVKVRYTDLEDSLTGGTDEDSTFVAHKSSRWLPHPDSAAQYLGEVDAPRMMDFSRADTILAFVGIFYGEGIVDSMLMSKKWIEEAIGDSVSNKLDGINSQNGITGSASQGVATIEIDWPWLRNFIDTCTATIPHATLADTTNGGAIRAETTKVVLHSWIYNKIDSTSASIRRADTSYAVEHGWIYNKIDTTSAKIPTASLADSCVKYDTVNVLNWTEVRTEIKTGAEIYNKIDTTSAKIPTASTADAVIINSIDSTHIKDGSVSTADLRDTLVTTAKIKDYNVTAVKIANNVIDSTKLTTASVDSAEIKASAVDSLKIRDASISDDDLRDTIVTTAKLKDYNITAVKIANNVIDSTKLTTASVDSAEIKAGSIDSLKIRDASISDDDLRDTIVTTAKIKDYNVTKVKVAADAVDSTKIVAGSVSTADLRDTLITTAKLKNFSVTAAKVDSTATFIIGNLRTQATNQGLIQSNNIAVTDPDSILKINGGAGLTIQSSITLGSDITDDSLVQELWPEYAGMTLFRGFSTTDIAYNDSIIIRGDADSANGNFLMFSDSTLTSGNHRRHVTIAIPVPDRVDSLRRVTIQVMSKDSTTGSVEFFMRGALFTRSPAYSLVDSAVGGSVLDRDSSCAAVLRTLHLNPASGNWTVTPFTTLYLLLSGRRDAGDAWNWGKAYKITAVWSRTRL